MSTLATSVRANELAAIVGDKHIVEATSALAPFAIDGIAPTVAVSPGSADEVAAVLRYAYERDLVVVPSGGFVHQEIGKTPWAIDVLLRMDRLSNVEHYDPGDLTIGVGAGFALSDLQSMVRDQRQVFPVDIANADRATIGGTMAVGAHGPHKHFFGGIREFCIGVRFVTADGKLGKGGGRVVKNVAGFDFMKLMIGSFGTLGVITSASFKLFPQPVATRTFVSEFPSVKEAIDYRDRVINSPLSPICLEMLSPRATGKDCWSIAVRAGGSDRVLARYNSELQTTVTHGIEGPEEQKFWADVENLGSEAPLRLSASLPPSMGGEFLYYASRIADENNLHFTGWGRIGIGSLLVAVENGMAESYVAFVQALRKKLPPDGSCVLTRCPVSLKPDINVWGSTPTNVEAMRMARNALSPKDNLNRGRFLL